ncbi:MAG: glycosyltransferase family 2 protein [Planctomycetota bacterium]|jgi:glycosyltransferase involved in cell wall biosynthesis
MKKVSIIIPALNEAEPLGEVLDRLKEALGSRRSDYVHEILVVDDGSSDDTCRIAEEMGARVIPHPENLGNGAAVKSGMRAAGGDCWVLMDADGQHDPAEVPRLIDGLERYDMVVGARTKGRGTGIHRNLANRVYNLLATYVSGRRIPDLTSGFRAMRASVARRFIYLLPNTFSYPTTLTLAFLRTGHSVLFEPIEAATRVGKSKIRLFRDGARFFYIIVRIATFFSPFKVFFPLSLLSALLGLGNYVYTFATQHRFTNMSMLLFVQAVILFALALISEQIAQLRFDRSEDVR